jgi:50S ribosomal protein L16 3-hydroxylase
VRAALPHFRAAVTLPGLKALARRADVESRTVIRSGRKFSTSHGPFSRLAVPDSNFTLLVSGVNLHAQGADALLRRFDFIPQARLDDVMVSYAVPGGGVGPHVDSYDVFLLQGAGRRRWRVWRPDGSFHREVIACQGDLLYLPPGWRHDGVALEACFTYSIGFRAPAGAELAARFLDWLHQRGLPDARYRDPGLRPASRPAAIPRQMLEFAARAAARIRWSAQDIETFLGEYLTEPKGHVVFKPSAEGTRLAAAQVRLDPKSQLLYSGRRFFINGESFVPRARQRAALRELADRRRLDGRRAAASGLGELIYDWRQSGYVSIAKRNHRG